MPGKPAPGNHHDHGTTIYLVSYSGAAIPGMVAGELTRSFDLDHIALGYAALGLVASIVAMLAALNSPHRQQV